MPIYRPRKSVLINAPMLCALYSIVNPSQTDKTFFDYTGIQEFSSLIEKYLYDSDLLKDAAALPSIMAAPYHYMSTKNVNSIELRSKIVSLRTPYAADFCAPKELSSSTVSVAFDKLLKEYASKASSLSEVEKSMYRDAQFKLNWQFKKIQNEAPNTMTYFTNNMKTFVCYPITSKKSHEDKIKDQNEMLEIIRNQFNAIGVKLSKENLLAAIIYASNEYSKFQLKQLSDKSFAVFDKIRETAISKEETELGSLIVPEEKS